MKLVKPFDIFPAPDLGSGSPNADEIFIEVGRSLTLWECIEEQLAEIFAGLTGGRKGADNLPAKRAYGAVTTFTVRKNMILQAAKARFGNEADKGILKSIEAILKDCENFSPRRNEIAHGNVKRLLIQHVQLGVKDETWYLLPSSYNSTKNVLVKNYNIVGHFDGNSDKKRAALRNLCSNGSKGVLENISILPK